MTSAYIIKCIHMFNTNIAGILSLRYDDAEFLECENLNSNGAVKFEDINIKSFANFQNAKFNNMEINAIKWPDKDNSILLDGMTYQNIMAKKQKEYIEEEEKERAKRCR